MVIPPGGLWEQDHERARQLGYFSLALAGSHALDEVGRIVVEPLHTALGANATVAYVALPQGGYRLVASRGLDPAILPVGSVLPPESPLPLVVAMRAGEPIWAETAEGFRARFPEVGRARSIRPDAVQAFAAVPMMFEGAAVGGVAFSFDAPRAFPTGIRELLTAVAAQCALAVERARLFEQERRAQARLEVLADASRTFAAASLRLSDVLDAVCGVVARVVGDACGLHLLGPDGTLELAALHGRDEATVASARAALAARPVRLGDDSMPGRVVAGAPAALQAGIPLDALLSRVAPEYREHLSRHPYHSVIVVPLRAREVVLGTVSTVRGGGSPAFTEADLALVQELADRAALVVENARLYTAVEAASRAKDEFLAMLGHELRNPLMAILAGARLARARPDDPVAVDAIERQARHVTRLVDDLLDISRISQRKLAVELRPTPLARVIDRAVEATRAAIDGRGVQLTVELPELPPVAGDEDRLVQVFANLLDNAAKFGRERGRVWISAAVDGGSVVASVTDDGPGVEPAVVGQLFQPFTQGRQGRERAAGLGLGLALVRALVELHGGTVDLTSGDGGTGASCRLRLPAAASPAAEPVPGPARVGRVAPRRVLVVDDNRDVAEVLARYLALDGHRVEVAHDGAAALAIAGELRPDLALVDLGLPDQDGAELGRRLRSVVGCERTRLVALTGCVDEAARARTGAAGFDRHLLKPATMEELDELLR